MNSPQMSQSNNPAKDEEFKARLVEMLREFPNTPTALADYLISNNAFRGSFVNKVCQSGNLGASKPARPAYFTDLEAMLEHQDSLLKKKANEHFDMEGDVHESNDQRDIRLYNQSLDSLRQALGDEDYARAAGIRDYMVMMKMSIPENIF